MTYFDRILDKHFIDFDKYTDRCCIGREEFEMICKEYAIEMCRLQLQECEKNCVLDTAFDDFYISAIKETQLPIELQ